MEHIIYCHRCDYTLTEGHNYENYTIISNTHHSKSCDCGYSVSSEEHSVHSFVRNTTASHYMDCECGQYLGEAPHVVPAGSEIIKFCIHCGQRINTRTDIAIQQGVNSVNPRTYITNAGSYVDSQGIIYLVEADMELYLAGELDVYALVDNLDGNVAY